MTQVFMIIVLSVLAAGWCLWHTPGAVHTRIARRWRPLILLILMLMAYALPWKSLEYVLILTSVGMVATAPDLAARILPFALIGYGLVGLQQFDYNMSLQATETYGGFGISAGWGSLHPLLYLGVAFCVAGGALVWWSPTTESAILRAGLGQLCGTGRVPGWLLAPIGLAWVLTVRMSVGHLFTAVAVVGGVSLVLVLRFNRIAAIVAVFALSLYGILGLLEVVAWPGSIMLGSQYGLFTVTSHARAIAAGVQGALLLTAITRLRMWPRLVADSPERELAERANWLSQRVQRLAQTRSDASEAAVIELKRIERDLHDGAQARLVALGMSLRAAERLMPVSPEAALALVTEARETSSRALTDLRDLVRGIYPPVLADRGLADALRSLALDAPMQVDVDIDLPDGVPMPIAAAVYFAAAEVLANAVRHSEAEHVVITGHRVGPALRVEISDDGVGGADPSSGTGLAGVERRLATFDGILAISSPLGGPTIVAIEAPCA